jgi:hypothetical protein
MSRFQQWIDLCLSREDAHDVCVTAILDLRWRIAGDAEGRIACQEAVEDVAPGISPTRIALSLSGCSHGPTRVMLNGAAFGSGSAQRVHVRQSVECLARAIHACAAPANLLATAETDLVLYCLPGADQSRRTFEAGGRGWIRRDAASPVVGVSPAATVVTTAPPAAEPTDHERTSERRASTAASGGPNRGMSMS